jgi:hypothetical protein
MIPHDAKVMNGEAIFLFRPVQEVQEELPHGAAREDQLSPVSPGSDVIGSVIFQFSWCSHTEYMKLPCEFALSLEDYF